MVKKDTDIKEIDIKEMQNKMLEMLLYFDQFCKENNLMYYLCGGCLIGAVRHKGFIPWDDDVDCFMPRDDYERLKSIWSEKADTSKYVYCRTDKFKNYHDAGASIRDVNTTCINRHSVNEDICHGIALEIMPIDGYPSSPISRCRQLLNAFMYSLFNVQRLPDNKGACIRLLTKIIYLLIPSKRLRYKIWSHCEAEMKKYSWSDCKYVTELIGSIKGMKLRHPKEWFDHVEYLEFEGHSLPVMKGYKQYLTLIWGDYMQLPPIEDRVAKHDIVFCDLNKSYKIYKGKYYLIDKEGGVK